MKRMSGLLAVGFLAVMALPAAAEPLTLSVTGGKPVSLPAGGVLGLEGPGLTLDMVAVIDQRCPSTMACYWEGMIRAEFVVNGMDRLILCNLCDDGSRDGAVPGYVLSLVRMFPDKDGIEALGRAAVVADYTVVLAVVAEP